MNEGLHQTFFDIETGPLPLAELEAMIPEFNPEDVKLGNLKDLVKIEAKLAEARENHRREFIDKAALDPMTGQILAIGYMDNEGAVTIHAVDAAECGAAGAVTDAQPNFTVTYWPTEKALIEAFLAMVRENFTHGGRMVGFNIFLFDLAFIIKRAWKHGLNPPRLHFRSGRYWSQMFIDLREIWQCGDWKGHGSLDAIAKFLGLPGKTGDGKFFSQLYEKERGAALDYLCHDLMTTRAISHGMGFAVPETMEPAGQTVAPGDY